MQIRLIVYIPIASTMRPCPAGRVLSSSSVPSRLLWCLVRTRRALVIGIDSGIAGLDSVARATRRETVKAVAHARGGHLGGPLSAIDVLVEFLHGQGFLGPEVAVAHVVYATSRGIELLAQTDTPVAHCPAITAKRGRFAPIRAIYAVVQGR